MDNRYPTLTPEREAFIDEVASGEFSKKLPENLTALDATVRMDFAATVQEVGHHISSMTVTLGAKNATEVKTASLLGAVQTVACHVMMTALAEGKSITEAREAVLEWLGNFSTDAGKVCSFLFHQDPAALASIAKYLTPAEVENAAQNARDRIEHARPIYFNSLASHMIHLLENFRDKHFTAAIRLRFGKLLAAWKGEAEAAFQDQLGDVSKPTVLH